MFAARAASCWLKRSSDARRDGDRVLAVIRGSAINQDGRSNGITAPNGPAQEAVIRAALDNAGVEPDQIGYVEAHGTGTPLGDPIEIGALAGGDRVETARADRPLLVGSVKTNIGHTEAAAGLAGVGQGHPGPAKGFDPAEPALSNGQSAHRLGRRANRGAYRSPAPFPANADGRRIAGVSAFGFSGTNAHVVFEGVGSCAGSRNGNGAARACARAFGALARGVVGACRALARSLRGAAAIPADLCHTANVGRAALEHRTAIVGRTTADFANALAAVRDGRPWTGSRVRHAGCRRRPTHCLHVHWPGRAFRRHGPGALSTLSGVPRGARPLCRCRRAARVDATCGEALFDPDPRSARGSARHPARELRASGGARRTLARVGYRAGRGDRAFASANMRQRTWPACSLWTMRWPWSLHADAARRAAPGEGPWSPSLLPTSAWRAALGEIGELEMAVYNGPEDFVVSGPPQAVAALGRNSADSGRPGEGACRAFGSHSRWVEPALPELAAAIASVSFSPSRIALAANITGALTAPDEMSNAGLLARADAQAGAFR